MDSLKGLLVLVTLLFGIVIGQVGGIVAAFGGATVSQAFGTGAAFFAGTTTLVLAILKWLSDRPDRS